MLGLPDPLSFRGDAVLLAGRYWAFPDGGVVAEESGQILGVAMANHWGSLGIFGPIAVHPGQWRQGIARNLLEATMPVFDRWDCRLVGLFTFPERISHVSFYQSFGFWPRALTAVMGRAVSNPSAVPGAFPLSAHPAERSALIGQCTTLAGLLFNGLDLGKEIELVRAAAPGETLLLAEGSRIAGFAVCHIGKGSEAGTDTLYVKFAAVAPGVEAPARFLRLLAACDDLAHRRGAKQVTAGVNLGRMEAYRLLLREGFRATLHGVAMHRPWAPAYDRPDIFALDDWR
jgi:GNAT superfamily N-acetyltransferase